MYIIDVYTRLFVNLSISFFSPFLINPETVAYVSEIAMNNSLSFAIKYNSHNSFISYVILIILKKRECFGNFKINWK